MRELRRINKTLDDDSLSCEERSALASFEDNLLDRLASAPPAGRAGTERSRRGACLLAEPATISRMRRGSPQAWWKPGVDRAALEKLGATVFETTFWLRSWRAWFRPSARKD